MEVCTVTLLIDIPVAMAITSFFCLSPSCVISQNGNVFSWLPLSITHNGMVLT